MQSTNLGRRCALVLVALLVIAFAGARSAEAEEPSMEHGRICVPPRTKPYDGCPKSRDEAGCRQAQARRAAVSPRFRINGGAWNDYSVDHWRCVAVPVDTSVKIAIENYGRKWKVIRTSVRAACASRTEDLSDVNIYGSMWTRCSRRARTTDELIAAP